MKCCRWLCLLLLTGAPLRVLAGDIQVICEPDLRVYLDGKFVATSSAREDGLFLANVPEGAHVIRVEKDGCVPQSFSVQVQKLPLEVRVKEFSPEPPARHEAVTSTTPVEQSVGSLLITSAPQNCVVEIDGKSEPKDTPLLRIEDLAAGEHEISFVKPGFARVTGVVSVVPGGEVTVRGDLQAGKVEVVNEGKGSLRVISTPEHCTVRLRGVTREKNHARLNISHIPAGEHRIVVSWRGLELTSDVVITSGRRTILTVSFMKGEPPFVVSSEPE